MRRNDGLPLVLLSGLVVLFFWKLALTHRVLAGVDLFTFFYPYRDYATRALLAGRLPLWNPDIFLGVPFLADSQTALFYPLHWPLIGLSAPRAIAWSIVMHVLLAAVGTYLFARRVAGLTMPGALTAAILFALGGFAGAQVEHVNQLNTAAWLPWLLLVLDRAIAGRRSAIPVGGILIAVMLFAGHAQAAYINLVAAGLFALLHPSTNDRRRATVGAGLAPALRGLASALRRPVGARHSCQPVTRANDLGERNRCAMSVEVRNASPLHVLRATGRGRACPCPVCPALYSVRW